MVRSWLVRKKKSSSSSSFSSSASLRVRHLIGKLRTCSAIELSTSRWWPSFEFLAGYDQSIEALDNTVDHSRRNCVSYTTTRVFSTLQGGDTLDSNERVTSKNVALPRTQTSFWKSKSNHFAVPLYMRLSPEKQHLHSDNCLTTNSYTPSLFVIVWRWRARKPVWPIPGIFLSFVFLKFSPHHTARRYLGPGRCFPIDLGPQSFSRPRA